MMNNTEWNDLDRWAQELITWVCRESPNMQEDSIILRLTIRDNVLYRVEKQLGNTRNNSRELAFEKDLPSPFA